MSKTYQYRYSVEDCDFDNSYKLESNWGLECPDYIAEDAADNYHSCHDGWENSWPLDISVFKEDGTLIGTFEVERETVPSFSASEKKRAPENQGSAAGIAQHAKGVERNVGGVAKS